MTKIVRAIAAHENETVLVRWTLDDGRVFHQEYTIPPRSTRLFRALNADLERPQDIQEPPRETPSRV